MSNVLLKLVVFIPNTYVNINILDCFGGMYKYSCVSTGELIDEQRR